MPGTSPPAAAPPPLDPILGLKFLPYYPGTPAAPIRRSSSLPLTTVIPPDAPFDIDAPPEHETQSIDSVDFISFAPCTLGMIQPLPNQKTLPYSCTLQVPYHTRVVW